MLTRKKNGRVRIKIITNFLISRIQTGGECITLNYADYQAKTLYAFHARRLNNKTSSQDGLKLGVAIVERWIYRKLGNCAPSWMNRDPNDLSSMIVTPYHIYNGYVVDTFYSESRCLWSLRLIAPISYLLSDDDECQHRTTVAVDIGFVAAQSELHCGIQVSTCGDENGLPENIPNCFTPVADLAEHPLFGLIDETPLRITAAIVDTQDKLSQMLNLIQSNMNTHAAVVFTQCSADMRNSSKLSCSQDEITAFLQEPERKTKIPMATSKFKPVLNQNQNQDPDYNMDKLARRLIGAANIYLVKDGLLHLLADALGQKITPGDALFVPSKTSDMKTQKFAYPSEKWERKKTIQKIAQRCAVHTSAVASEVKQGAVEFFGSSSRIMEEEIRNIRSAAEANTAALREQFAAEQSCASQQISELLKQKEQLSAQVTRIKEYQNRLENEKSSLQAQIEEVKSTINRKEHEDSEKIAYLYRALDRPTIHENIPAWAEKHFSERLTIIPKAAAMLSENSSKAISLPLICDALDFLATDCWESRFNRMTWDQVLSSCAIKYGRPFDVAKISYRSIEYAASQFKIQYAASEKEKKRECSLNLHLKVGNDPENLLRIYFMLDEENKKIVVGSLPKHLKSVT